jgi:hypothetical protein
MPTGPVGPVAPFAPFDPIGPVGPLDPLGPFWFQAIDRSFLPHDFLLSTMFSVVPPVALAPRRL